MQLMDLTALELGERIRRRECSVEDAVRASLDAIRARDGKISAFITVTEDEALRDARLVQKGIDDGTLTHPLAACPWRSRTTSPPGACVPPAPRAC